MPASGWRCSISHVWAGLAFALSDPRGMLSGSYLGAVTLGPDGTPTITLGYLVTTVLDEIDAPPAGDLVVSMDLPSTLDIAAVLTLDGELVGLAYNTPAGHRVISSTELLSLIEALETETVCRSIEVPISTRSCRRCSGFRPVC